MTHFFWFSYILLFGSYAFTVIDGSNSGSHSSSSHSTTRRLGAKEASHSAHHASSGPNHGPSAAPAPSTPGNLRQTSSGEMIAPSSQHMHRAEAQRISETSRVLAGAGGVVAGSVGAGHLAIGCHECCTGKKKSGCRHCALGAGCCALAGCMAAAAATGKKYR